MWPDLSSGQYLGLWSTVMIMGAAHAIWTGKDIPGGVITAYSAAVGFYTAHGAMKTWVSGNGSNGGNGANGS